MPLPPIKRVNRPIAGVLTNTDVWADARTTMIMLHGRVDPSLSATDTGIKGSKRTKVEVQASVWARTIVAQTRSGVGIGVGNLVLGYYNKSSIGLSG